MKKIMIIEDDPSIREELTQLLENERYLPFPATDFNDISAQAVQECPNLIPYQISGGQKQRAACARAMVAGQSLLLADEPTGALDSKASKNLLEIMSAMNQDMGATILMVTHDAYSASYAKRVLFLKDGRVFNEPSRPRFWCYRCSIWLLLLQ